jgi:hypothetical protein
MRLRLGRDGEKRVKPLGSLSSERLTGTRLITLDKGGLEEHTSRFSEINVCLRLKGVGDKLQLLSFVTDPFGLRLNNAVALRHPLS